MSQIMFQRTYDKDMKWDMSRILFEKNLDIEGGNRQSFFNVLVLLCDGRDIAGVQHLI